MGTSSDGIYPNPNVAITNLSIRILTNDKYETLQYGLKRGIASKPKDNEIFAIAEDIYDQIEEYVYKIRYLWNV